MAYRGQDRAGPSLGNGRAGPSLVSGRADLSQENGRAYPSLGNGRAGPSLGNLMEVSCCSSPTRNRRAEEAGARTAWWLNLGLRTREVIV